MQRAIALPQPPLHPQQTKHRGKSIGGAIAKRGAELTDFAEKHSPTITSAIRTILGF
ncbi:MAG: hypothetical protein HC878_06685 [Leptolyngbyaceae cyanobacterium SL_5_14]|nr:hypothetical protein [Leptolyngbyaceae cyanobacterium SL_5_14]